MEKTTAARAHIINIRGTQSEQVYKGQPPSGVCKKRLGGTASSSGGGGVWRRACRGACRGNKGSFYIELKASDSRIG